MIRWIDAGYVSGIRSQSIYHGLGNIFDSESQNTIVLAIPADPYLCISYFQDPRIELDLAYCKKKKLPIIRRRTGGGAVYIDDRQLFIQWIFHPNTLPPKVSDKFELFLQPIIETYKFFGINAYSYRSHDVHVNGRKIVGTGAARIGNADVITGNIILDFDSNTMTQALKYPSKAMAMEVKKGMEVNMTSMRNELSILPSFSEIKKIYKLKCQEIFDAQIVEDTFNSMELKEFEEQDQNLSADTWTFEIEGLESAYHLIKIHGAVWVGCINFKKDEIDIDLTLRWRERVIESVDTKYRNKASEKLSTSLKSCLIGLKMEKDSLQKGLSSCLNPDKMKYKMALRDTILFLRKEQLKKSGNSADLDENLLNKVLSDVQISRLYQKIPNTWVLLEPLVFNRDNRATSLKILSFDHNKDKLRDLLLENDDWISKKSLLYFFTGNDGTCSI